jgi:CrcB protein
MNWRPMNRSARTPEAEARRVQAVLEAVRVGSPDSIFGRVVSSPAWGALTLNAAVAAGAALGAGLRALCSQAAAALIGGAFPWGTLFVNVVGSFVIGFFATLSEPGGRMFLGTRRRHFVMTGLCGGFTTFSVFSLEVVRLIQAHALTMAAVTVTVSVITWLAAVWIGHTLALRLNRLGGI